MASIVIAALSTCIALVSLAISLLTYLERKPKLHFIFSYVMDKTGGLIECEIFNLGHDVVILSEYGYETKPEDPKKYSAPWHWLKIQKNGTPGTVRLAPYEHYVFSFPRDKRKYAFNDFWVEDVSGKRHAANRHQLELLNVIVEAVE
jgi:hypothetical protein